MGMTAGAASSLDPWPLQEDFTFDAYVHAQLEHDRLCHGDVMLRSRRYQFRHSIKHLDKVVGLLATLCEKQFHGEAVEDLRTDLRERRLPDAQAFVFKIAALAGTKESQLGPWARRPNPLATGQRETDTPDSDEAAYARLRAAVIALAPDYAALMGKSWTPGPATISPAAIESLQLAVLAAANRFDIDMATAYPARMAIVRQAKLA